MNFAGAVVDREVDSPCPHAEVRFTATLKLDEILYGCSAEAIEGLIIVANDANVLASLRQAEEDPFLDRVRVLILVDDYMGEYVASNLVLDEVLVRL